MIDYSTLNKNSDIVFYNMNNSINYYKNKIAYVFLKESDEYIYIYDIPTKNWNYVWNELKLTDDYTFNALWDKNDNLYFDSWGLVLDENKQIASPREHYHNTYKYTLDDKSLHLYLDNYNIHSSSRDLENILLKKRSIHDEYYIYNLEQEKFVHEFEADIYHICWSNDGKYVAYYSDSSDSICIYSLASNKTYEQKIDYLNDTRYLVELSPEDDYFIFFIQGENSKGDL